METLLIGIIIGLVIGVIVGAKIAPDKTIFEVAKQKVKGNGKADFNNNIADDLVSNTKKPKFGFLKRIFKKKKV